MNDDGDHGRKRRRARWEDSDDKDAGSSEGTPRLAMHDHEERRTRGEPAPDIKGGLGPQDPAAKAERDRFPRTAIGKHGVVATSHPDATDAAVRMLEQGGNAFDAAVAATLALCVCEPAANGLGGQTMLLFHDATHNKTVALDGSSRAPNRATPDNVPEDERAHGYKATTVPSTPAVCGYLLDHYGRLARNVVFEPAIRLARDGFTVSRFYHDMLVRKLDQIKTGNAADILLRDDGRPYDPGQTCRQPALARTLERLRDVGFEDFYTGEIAARIAEDMRDNDGILGAHDLAQIPWPIVRDPDVGAFRRFTVKSFPPPGAGRVLLQILNVLEKTDDEFIDPDTPKGAVMLARNIQQALFDHREEPRDPARHAQLPQKMHGRRRTALLANRMQRGIQTGQEGHGETSHMSIMDDEGNVVGVTQSIEEFFGACVATPDLGFLYNNYLGAFAHEDPSHPYALRPNAVPWSSVAPTLLYKGRKPMMMLGSPGSDRIPSAVAQVLLRWHLDGDLMEAVKAPRLHGHPDGTVHIEAERFSDEVLETLAENDWKVERHRPWSLYCGSVQAVCRKGGKYYGVADPRRDGTAEGVDERQEPLLRVRTRQQEHGYSTDGAREEDEDA